MKLWMKNKKRIMFASFLFAAMLLIWYSPQNSQAAEKEFIFNGRNIALYDGQPVLVVDKKKINRSDTKALYRHRKKLDKVKTIRYTNKVKKIVHQYKKSIYDACKNTTKVIYGKNVKTEYLKTNEFELTTEPLKRLKNLKSVVVDRRNKELYSLDGILYNSHQTRIRYWYGKTPGKTLHLAPKLKRIYTENVKNKVRNVKTLVIDKKLKGIGDYYYCFKDALIDFVNLKTVKIAKGNKIFEVQDGCLYGAKRFVGYINKSGCTRLRVPKGVIGYYDEWMNYHKQDIFTLVIPSSVEYYIRGDDAGHHIPVVKEYEVSKKNSHFFTDEGSLYKKNKKKTLVSFAVNSRKQLRSHRMHLYSGCKQWRGDAFRVKYSGDNVLKSMTYVEDLGRKIPSDIWKGKWKINITGYNKYYSNYKNAWYNKKKSFLYRVDDIGQKKYTLLPSIEDIDSDAAFEQWRCQNKKITVELGEEIKTENQIEMLKSFQKTIHFKILPENHSFVIKRNMLMSEDNKIVYYLLYGKNTIYLTREVEKLNWTIEVPRRRLHIVVGKDVRSLSSVQYIQESLNKLVYTVNRNNPYFSEYRTSVFNKTGTVLIKPGYKIKVRVEKIAYYHFKEKQRHVYLPASCKKADKNAFTSQMWDRECINFIIHLTNKGKAIDRKSFYKQDDFDIYFVVDKD